MSLDVATLGLGDLVSYEDVANPRRQYLVRALPDPAAIVPEYRLEDVETGETTTSDCRQSGWRLEAPARAEGHARPWVIVLRDGARTRGRRRYLRSVSLADAQRDRWEPGKPFPRTRITGTQTLVSARKFATLDDALALVNEVEADSPGRPRWRIQNLETGIEVTR